MRMAKGGLDWSDGVGIHSASCRRVVISSTQARCSGFMRTERRQVTVVASLALGHPARGKKRAGRWARARWSRALERHGRRPAGHAARIRQRWERVRPIRRYRVEGQDRRQSASPKQGRRRGGARLPCSAPTHEKTRHRERGAGGAGWPKGPRQMRRARAFQADLAEVEFEEVK